MMNFIYTLLTIAAGMLFGIAGVFLSRKRMSSIKIVFSGLGMMLLLWGCGTVGILCEQKILRAELSWLDIISVLFVIIYGAVTGAIVSLIPLIKQDIKQGKKLDLQILIYACAMIVIPLIMWGYALWHDSLFSTLNLLSITVVWGYAIIGIIFIINDACIYFWRRFH